MKWLINTRTRDWRYHLSRLVPIRMRSTYGVTGSGRTWYESARWWQWRGRVFAHQITRHDMTRPTWLTAVASTPPEAG